MSTVTCTRCGKKVSSSEVRFVTSKDFVCPVCYTGLKGDTRKPQKPEKYDARPIRKEEFECEKCGFVNRFAAGTGVRRSCSYCGSENLRLKQAASAKLLAEADDDLFELTDE